MNDNAKNKKPWNYQVDSIVKCDTCGKEFQRAKSKIGENNYCCRECYTESKKKQTGEKHPLHDRVNVACDTCGKDFTKTPYKYSRSKNHFCSVECKNNWVEESQAREGYKICSKCGEEVKATPDYFYRDGQTRDGLSPQCKECRNAENLLKYPEKRTYYRNYKKDNKEKLQKYVVKYRQENRDKMNWYSQKRRADMKRLEATLTVKQWEQIKKAFDNKCAYCGKEIPLEQEHFIALSEGGEYTHNNIIPACRSCNASKNNRDFFEWYSEQEYYSKKRKNKILEYLNYKDEDIQQLSIL